MARNRQLHNTVAAFLKMCETNKIIIQYKELEKMYTLGLVDDPYFKHFNENYQKMWNDYKDECLGLVFLRLKEKNGICLLKCII